MKCDYCQGEDHLVSACGQKKGERRLRVSFGVVFLLILFPFAVIGAVCGAAWGAFMRGFGCSRDMWDLGVRVVRGKQDERESEV